MTTPTIAELIRDNATTISDSVELYHLILRHHPQASIDTVIAEMRRQAEADLTEAYRIEAYVIRRE